MRIATWNLARPRGKRAEALKRHVQGIEADIWILTETRQDFSPGDDFQPAVSSLPDPSRDSDERWVSIWSRFRVSGVPVTADSTRTACARVEWPGHEPLLVYGTVLPWLGSPWNDVPAKDGQAFAAALDAQGKEWRKIRANDDYRGHHFCLAGDFNQDLNPQHFYGSNAGKNQLQEALLATDLECVTCGDNDPVIYAANAPHANIDHICFDKSLAKYCKLPATVWPAKEELGPRLSDHFGVCVETVPK